MPLIAARIVASGHDAMKIAIRRGFQRCYRKPGFYPGRNGVALSVTTDPAS